MMRRIVAGSLGASAGFTRVEALTLALGIAFLAILQLPLHGDARSVSRASTCLAGLRQLQLGWTLYAGDHGGRIVSGASAPAAGAVWAPGYLDFTADSRNWDPAFFPGKSPLLPYAGRDPMTYRCPSDPSRVLAPSAGSTTRQPTPRSRSRSLNCWVGGPGWLLSAPWRHATSIDQLMDPGPADTLTFIDEHEDSINDGKFEIDMAGFPARRGTTANPDLIRLVDFPSDWHRGGAGVAFADGHVDVRRWTDARTAPRPRTSGFAANIPSPNNTDVIWMQERTPRIAP